MDTMKVSTSVEIPSEMYAAFATAFACLIETLFADAAYMPPFDIKATSSFKMKEALSREAWNGMRDEILTAMGAGTPMDRYMDRYMELVRKEQ